MSRTASGYHFALVVTCLCVLGAARAHASESDGPSYGLALRARYVSVPSWMLRVFTTHNVPLSTFGHFGLEVFRRRGKTELVGAISYQNMSPPDGNWLG